MIERTPQLEDSICDRLIEGESMRTICATEGFPSRSTVRRWRLECPDFEAKCARARDMQDELMDDLILDTAKACTEDNYQSSKVKISAYQWRASKLNPRKWGEKLEQTIQGGVSVQLLTDIPRPPK